MLDDLCASPMLTRLHHRGDQHRRGARADEILPPELLGGRPGARHVYVFEADPDYPEEELAALKHEALGVE